MISARLPANESARLAALQALQVLDTPPEEQFDALVKAASLVCGVPISLISLIDAERQWFKANVGLPQATETPRDVAFCAHAILEEGLFEVPDATQDPRFATNPLVCGQPDIRFYAGAPLTLQDGSRIGTLCVIDRQPRQLNDMQREVLRQLARTAAQALEMRVAARHHRAATEELATSEAWFRAVSGGAPHGVFCCDHAGDCTYTNARWQEIHGLTQAQSLGDGWRAALHPQDRVAVLHEWRRTVSQQRPFDMEYRIRRGGGELRHLHVRARPVQLSGREMLGYVGSVEDITERQQILDSLAASQDRQRRLYEHTPAMLHSIDMQGRLLSVSNTWLAKMGYERDEVIGRHSTEFLTPASREYAQTTVLPAFFASGHCERVEYQMVTRSGEVLDVHLSAVLDRNAAGRPLRTVAVIEDVTARRCTERALAVERQRLVNLIEGTHAATWEWNVQTGELRVNARWDDLLGTALSGTDGLLIDQRLSRLHPDDLAPVSRALTRHFEGETAHYECELRMRHRDGHWVWLLDRARVMSWTPEGRPEWLYGIHLDISERKQQEEALRKSESFLARTGAVARVGGWELELTTLQLNLSDETCRLHALPLGHRPSLDEAVGYYKPEAQQVLHASVERAMRLGVPFDHVLPLVRADGVEIWGQVVGSVELFDGKPRWLRGAFQDVTEQVGERQALQQANQRLRGLAQELAEQHELLRVTLQSIGDAVITTDAQGRVVWLNPVAERMTGWLSGEAIGRPLAQVFHIVNEETRLPTESPVDLCLAQGKVVGLANHTLLISREGDEFGIEDSAAPIRNDKGVTLGVVLVFHDVTEQRRLSGEMSHRAKHDALTGLVNRTAFDSRLRHLLHKTHEDRGLHALMYIDLDQFKLVNDACGHAVGDQLLQQVAKLLAEVVRSRDTLARLGGDEFAVLLEHCSADQAQRVAQQICERMDDFRFVHEERRFRIGTSIGLVPVDNRWANTAAILQAADAACYAAKEAGRNRVHTWFDSDLAIRTRNGEMKWATRIEQALDDNRFELHAQRILPLQGSGHGLHAEVLLRMIDTDGSRVLPGAFLPAAERFHLASRIDRWVLRATITWMKAQPSLAHIGELCVNLSGQSIGDRTFHRWATEALSVAGEDVCSRLCLEVTETAAVTNLADAALFIEQIRAVGVRVALDDFGAGASSFGYLKTLPVDTLKIDGQFVRDLLDDPLDEAAVRCFVDVAKLMRLKTVAEFVDREETLAHLRAMGVDFAQGYFVHRPAPIEALTQDLKARQAATVG